MLRGLVSLSVAYSICRIRATIMHLNYLKLPVLLHACHLWQTVCMMQKATRGVPACAVSGPSAMLPLQLALGCCCPVQQGLLIPAAFVHSCRWRIPRMRAMYMRMARQHAIYSACSSAGVLYCLTCTTCAACSATTRWSESVLLASLG